jgi:hypothetical protein
MMNPVIAPNSKDLPFTLYESGAHPAAAAACAATGTHKPLCVETSMR